VPIKGLKWLLGEGSASYFGRLLSGGGGGWESKEKDILLEGGCVKEQERDAHPRSRLSTLI